MGSIVIDASVVLALLDPDDALHERAQRALDLLDDDADYILPASCLAEILVRPSIRSDDELDRVADVVQQTFGSAMPLDGAVAKAAARRRGRHRALRLPDAIVLASADVAGAEVILTGDRSWRRLDQRVRVV